MIRVVLTVLVAVALLAASMPAVETARTATTAERLGAETDRLERAIGGVVSESAPVGDPAMAAGTTVLVRVPTGFAAAETDGVALVESAEGPGGVALAYRIDGGPRRTLRVGTGPAETAVDLVGGPVELRPGPNRVRIRYVDDGGPTVRIGRIG
ncbi:MULTISPECIES: hypothetical protein [Halorubrum]|uniref:DUF7311 domain-containing protein n=1 Tax=Halorubrum tropicale TaxID=1765655 RepID=A0A0M9ANQ8_9EURY|nr:MULTISPECIES: hypothetical protein [Halorubrum]KOX95777.1 hypothetical protein AMR74_12615 [Halorubrum tropicale]TKX44499.1 hypothetical protein EXE50_05420 [Halorubrum sp. ARQ200]TKX48620.1 hypothetical protein EXE49_16270 [Halorubrum sp. ASP121]TKX62847.1 hypothetical protein EXE48_03510 [Halorubrum sp. ASP1]